VKKKKRKRKMQMTGQGRVMVMNNWPRFFSFVLHPFQPKIARAGWRSGDNTRLPPVLIWPGFDFLTRRRMGTEFVGYVLCSERFFAGYSGFRLLPKINI